MSKPSKEKKQAGLPAEYSEGTLHFKTGPGWKACYDSERDLYTAESFWAGYYDLYEINEKLIRCPPNPLAHFLFWVKKWVRRARGISLPQRVRPISFPHRVWRSVA